MRGIARYARARRAKQPLLPEQMGEYLDLFRTNTAERLSLLAAHASANNWTGLAAEAHAIAGTAGTVGALELSRAARELEQACKREAEPALLCSLADTVQSLAEAADKELGNWFEAQADLGRRFGVSHEAMIAQVCDRLRLPTSIAPGAVLGRTP